MKTPWSRRYKKNALNNQLFGRPPKGSSLYYLILICLLLLLGLLIEVI